MVYKEIEIDSTWQQPLGEIRVIQEEADGRKLIIHLYDNGTCRFVNDVLHIRKRIKNVFR